MNIPFTKLYQQYLDCKSEIDNAMKILTKAKEFKRSKQKEDVYRYFLANKY